MGMMITTSFLRKQEISNDRDWIPAYAGMTNGVGTTHNNNVIPAKAGISGRVTTKQGSVTSNPIDVLVAYTQRVEDYEGGLEQVKATIENEVAKMNQVLDNSGLSHRQIRLVAIEKVDYSQKDHVATDLNNFENTSADNYNNFDFSPMDEVHDLREKYQADLIHLVVKEARGLCGASGVYGLPQENWIKEQECQNSLDPDSCLILERQKEWKKQRSSSVSAVKCFSGYTFTHELGHNLALDHDRADNVWDEFSIERGIFTFRPYAFGYQNLDFSEICQVTIMSGGNDCIEAGIYGQLWLPYFSNPDLFFPKPDGQYASSPFKEDSPMGVPGDEYTIDPDGPVNASRAIDDVWDIVAGLLGDDSSPVVSSCNEGDIPSNVLSSSLNSQTEISASGGTRNMMISFSVPDNCSGVSVIASSSSSVVSTSVQRVREGEFQLSITANANNASCSTRRAEVTVELSGVSGVSPASTTVTQASNNEFCSHISELPANSTSLDLSGQKSIFIF